MLFVNTVLKKSPIDGLGLFANQFIPQGAVVWRFTPGFDIEVREKKLKDLSPPARKQFLKYAFLEPGTDNYILCFDDARFSNHSDHPNCVNVLLQSDNEWAAVAARDIFPGDELTCDYKDFDGAYRRKLRTRRPPAHREKSINDKTTARR